MNPPDYSVDHFLTKFSAIPDELWIEREYVDLENPARRCAIGHCYPATATRREVWDTALGEGEPDEVRALREVLDVTIQAQRPTVEHINNGFAGNHPTPKARMLSALHDAKAKQQTANP